MNKKHKRGILTLGMFVSMFTTSDCTNDSTYTSSQVCL